jgi:hypothetical protein
MLEQYIIIRNIYQLSIRGSLLELMKKWNNRISIFICYHNLTYACSLSFKCRGIAEGFLQIFRTMTTEGRTIGMIHAENLVEMASKPIYDHVKILLHVEHCMMEASL